MCPAPPPVKLSWTLVKKKLFCFVNDQRDVFPPPPGCRWRRSEGSPSRQGPAAGSATSAGAAAAAACCRRRFCGCHWRAFAAATARGPPTHTVHLDRMPARRTANLCPPPGSLSFLPPDGQPEPPPPASLSFLPPDGLPAFCLSTRLMAPAFCRSSPLSALRRPRPCRWCTATWVTTTCSTSSTPPATSTSPTRCVGVGVGGGGLVRPGRWAV